MTNNESQNLNEEIKILNETILSLRIEKNQIEEEKNQKITSLLSQIEQMQAKINNLEIKQNQTLQLDKNNTVQSFVSEIESIISKYKTALKTITVNEDIFLRNILLTKLIFKAQPESTILNDQNFLEKLRTLKNENIIYKEQISFLKNKFNQHKSLINDYKERMTNAINKIKEILQYVYNVDNKLKDSLKHQKNLEKQIDCFKAEQSEKLLLKNRNDYYCDIINEITAFIKKVLADSKLKDKYGGEYHNLCEKVTNIKESFERKNKNVK